MYLQKQLVLSNSLYWFDQVGGDGVGETMPLLDFLQRHKTFKQIKHADVFIVTFTYNIYI